MSRRKVGCASETIRRIGELAKIRTAKARAAGLCVSCHKEEPAFRRKVCDKCRERNAGYVKKRKEKGQCAYCTNMRADGINSCEQCRLQRNAKQRDYKIAIITHYGGKCACCGENEIDFLTVDHIDGGGAKHRREIFGTGRGCGVHFYRWLKRNKFPIGFQILCWNCNSSKHLGGICAHKRKSGANQPDQSQGLF